jgi:hypothetical protein
LAFGAFRHLTHLSGMNPEEQLLQYFDLSEAEKRAFDKKHDQNPELAKIRKLDALFHSISVSEEATENALSGRSKDERLNQRVSALQNGSQDIVAHFEAVTGQRLSAGMQLMKPKTSVFRYAMAACFSFFAVAALFYFGLQKPPQYALSNVDLYTSELEKPTLRGEISKDELETLYFSAAADLQAAHKSYFGLFAHYDAETLNSAIQKFEKVVKVSPAESVFQTEGYFFLAKAYLAQNNPQKAKQALKWVIALKGAKSNEAQKMLEKM